MRRPRHEGSRRPQLRSPAGDRGDADPRAGTRAGARADRGLRPLPHGHPRRARRMAGQADAAVHPRPRGRRHRREARAGQQPRARAGDARGAAVARLRLRRLPLLQHRARDAVPSSSTWATRSTAASPSTRSATPATSCACRTASTPRRRSADVRGRDHLQGRQGLRAPTPRASSPSSAPAASATWRSSTRASPARRWSRSTPTRRGSRRRSSSAPSMSCMPASRTPWPRSSALGGADAAISTAVNPIAFEQALGSLAAAARSCASGCRRRTACAVPIFETVLGGLTSAARSSARTTTSRRSSSCTAAA